MLLFVAYVSVDASVLNASVEVSVVASVAASVASVAAVSVAVVVGTSIKLGTSLAPFMSTNVIQTSVANKMDDINPNDELAFKVYSPCTYRNGKERRDYVSSYVFKNILFVVEIFHILYITGFKPKMLPYEVHIYEKLKME